MNDKQNFSLVQVGPMDSWNQFRFEVPGLPPKPKHFLKDLLGLTGMEVSLNAMAPGESMPFVHRHKKNEELYLFLSGEGEFQADQQLFPISAGTCIRCATDVRRAWRNTGDTELLFVVIQAAEKTYGELATIQDGELVQEQMMWL